MAEQETAFIVLDADGNAVKVKADRFYLDQGMIVLQAQDSTGGYSEVAAFSAHSNNVFNESNVVAG